MVKEQKSGDIIPKILWLIEYAEPRRKKVTNDRFLDGLPGKMGRSLIEIVMPGEKKLISFISNQHSGIKAKMSSTRSKMMNQSLEERIELKLEI